MRDVTLIVELASRQIERGLWSKGGDVDVEFRAAAGARVGAATTKIEAGARGVLVRVPIDGTSPPWVVSARITGGDFPIDDRIQVSAPIGVILGPPIVFRATPAARSPLRSVADFLFRRTERVHVEWPVLKPLDQRIARVLDRRGQPVAVGATVTERAVDGVAVVAVDLNLAPLSEGDYVIELVVGSGAETERKLVAIHVA